MSENEKNKRESGLPGGGAGRKDEVGRSGVYPMSGPHPPGPAEVRTEAGWGQGERGAAGYEDHGGSELSWDGRELLGGLGVGPGGEAAGESELAARDIDRQEWITFLDDFSRRHRGWRARVEVVDANGQRRMLHEDAPLEGVNSDHLNDPDERVYVEIGENADRLVHSIPAPQRVIFVENRQGQHLGLEIDAADGSRTFVRFRAASTPESSAA